MEPLREPFPVHASDADAFGLLTAPGLAGYMQEIAVHHAAALGVGMEALRARGLAWALEAVPEETWRTCRLAALETHYLAECRYGSAILSRAAPAGAGEFRHAVVREEDGRELARLWTRWVPR